MHDKNIIHLDLKCSNILAHLPEIEDLKSFREDQVTEYPLSWDADEKIQIKISNF